MTEATAARILEAAETLFRDHGLRSVGVDAIAARAGVAKRTLYNHFPSKDDLIGACLEARDSAVIDQYRDWLGDRAQPMPRRMKGLFQALADHARHPRWRGCGFTRTAVELAGQPGHPGVVMASRHKKRLEAWLERELQTSGASAAAELARHVALLIEGAITQILIHGDTTYALAAGQAAATLVAADLAQSCTPAPPPAAVALPAGQRR